MYNYIFTKCIFPSLVTFFCVYLETSEWVHKGFFVWNKHVCFLFILLINIEYEIKEFRMYLILIHMLSESFTFSLLPASFCSGFHKYHRVAFWSWLAKTYKSYMLLRLPSRHSPREHSVLPGEVIWMESWSGQAERSFPSLWWHHIKLGDLGEILAWV